MQTKQPSITIPLFAFSLIVAASGGFIGSYVSVSVRLAVIEEKINNIEKDVRTIEQEVAVINAAPFLSESRNTKKSVIPKPRTCIAILNNFDWKAKPLTKNLN